MNIYHSYPSSMNMYISNYNIDIPKSLERGGVSEENPLRYLWQKKKL